MRYIRTEEHRERMAGNSIGPNEILLVYSKWKTRHHCFHVIVSFALYFFFILFLFKCNEQISVAFQELNASHIRHQRDIHRKHELISRKRTFQKRHENEKKKNNYGNKRNKIQKIIWKWRYFFIVFFYFIFQSLSSWNRNLCETFTDGIFNYKIQPCKYFFHNFSLRKILV